MTATKTQIPAKRIVVQPKPKGGRGVPAGLTSTTTPAGIAAHDPDVTPEAAAALGVKTTKGTKATKKNGKPELWPHGLSRDGHPTFVCPKCLMKFEQTICPGHCANCGTAGDPRQGKMHRFDEFGLYTLDELEQLKTNGVISGTKPAKPETTPPKPETTSAAGETRRLIEVDLDSIEPSPHNPRKSFPNDKLDELIASIEQIGLQSPLVVLPAVATIHELVDGERRYRALKSLAKKDPARWSKVLVEVKPLTADQARDYRLATFVRAGLNPIEEALALREACAGGLTQAAAGKLCGMTQAAVANKIRLLKAPEALQQKIISGEMTEGAARDLLKYADFGDALETATRQAGKALHSIEWRVRDLLDERSRPMHRDKWYSDAVLFKVTPAIEAELDIRQVDGEKRAFNAARWDELQAAAQAKASKRKDREASDPKETAAERKAKAEKQAAQFADRLHRWEIRWLQRAIVARVDRFDDELLLRLLLFFTVTHNVYGSPDNDRREGLRSALRGAKAKLGKQVWDFDPWGSLGSVTGHVRGVALAAVKAWLAHNMELSCDIDDELVESLAVELKIDRREEWKQLSGGALESFLQLHAKDQLAALADEWEVCIAIPGCKRSELIEILRAHPRALTSLPAALGGKKKGRK